MTFILDGTWTLIAGVMVLFLPGIAWLSLFWEPDQGIFERLAEAMGVSISLTALMALFAFLVGWEVSSLGLIALYLILIPFTVWQLRLKWRGGRVIQGEASNESEHIHNSLHLDH